MIPLWTYPLLFLTGLAAGFVDAIAGGGGLITLPVMLNLGLPTADALGANKLQAAFGSGSAAWHYGRAGMIDWKDCALGIAFTFIGAWAGTQCVTRLDPELLRRTIPWLLVVIALYTLFRPTLGDADRHARWSRQVFYPFAGLALGFYDGFFGPGTGSFWAMALVLGMGFNLSRATAHTKAMNFASNLASLLVFALQGHVHLAAGLTMGVGQLLGARLGSRAVIRRGTELVRPVFVCVALAITAKLFWRG